MNNDLISREALKNDISERLCDKFDKWNKTITVSEFETVVIDAIDSAPTVEPIADRAKAYNNGYANGYKQGLEIGKGLQRPKGEWVWVQYDANPNIGNFHCSACGYIPKDLKGRYRSYIQYSSMKYCPNCGAEAENDTIIL